MDKNWVSGTPDTRMNVYMTFVLRLAAEGLASSNDNEKYRNNMITSRLHGEEWEEPIWAIIDEPVAQDCDYIAAMTDEEFEEWERLQPEEYFENAVHDEL